VTAVSVLRDQGVPTVRAILMEQRIGEPAAGQRCDVMASNALGACANANGKR
jgi:hypothetical protein